MGSTVRRLAFALRFGEINLFTSGLITGESRILYVRDVRARVQLLAPFLDFDSDPYPVIIDGRMKWVIDAYTTTDRYPYAQRADTDALPAGQRARPPLQLRAQLGEGRRRRLRRRRHVLHRRPAGPDRARVVEGVPEAVHRHRSIPAELQTHFRYPDDIFRVQTETWGRYHIEDPGDFYQRSDAWNVAQNPPKEQESRTATPVATVVGSTLASTRERRVPPYYTLMVQPGTNNLAVRVGAIVRAVLRQRSAQDVVGVHDRVERPGRLREAARLRDVEPVARRALVGRLHDEVELRART